MNGYPVDVFAVFAGYQGRIDWHVDRLCALADGVDRPLSLIVRGGIPALARLRSHFAHVVLIETEAFARTLKRRRAEINSTGRLRWIRVTTEKGAPLDDLLAHNIAERRKYLLAPPQPRPIRLVRPSAKRTAKHANSEAGQMSLMPEFEFASQAWAVASDFQGVIVAAKA